MSNGRSASVLVPLSSLVRPQRISWRAASRHIHELRRHRETLRPAGQHSRRGVAPVCSLERVRPLERDTGPSEGLRLRFGKEKTLAARDNSVGILGAGGHRGRIPPSAGPEGSHERVPSAQICCELRTGRLFRESNGRGLSRGLFCSVPVHLATTRALRRPPGSLGEASPRAPPCRETCTAPSRMFTSHARRSSLRRKKNLCTLISFLFPFPEEVFLRGRRAVTTAAGNARRRSAVSDVRPKTNQF